MAMEWFGFGCGRETLAISARYLQRVLDRVCEAEPHPDQGHVRRRLVTGRYHRQPGAADLLDELDQVLDPGRLALVRFVGLDDSSRGLAVPDEREGMCTRGKTCRGQHDGDATGGASFHQTPPYTCTS